MRYDRMSDVRLFAGMHRAMMDAKAQRGFTLVELVTVLLITSVLAFFVIGKLSTPVFSQKAFNDKVTADIEYARKYGVAHRRYVCIRTASNTITFTLDQLLPESRTFGLVCGGTASGTEVALTLATADTNCSGAVNTVCAPSGMTITPSAAAVTLDATGGNTTGTATYAIANTATSTSTTVTIEGVTGYVH
jgi:prepilin-type N-terminal cleavage/methylation domain-containing protein